MAIINWRGDAPARSKISQFAFSGTWETGDLIVATINGKTVKFTAVSATIAAIIDSIVTAWNALDDSVYPEFRELTAERSGSNLKFTAATAGKPFTVNLTTTESNGGAADGQVIAAESVIQASSGPEDASEATNYSGGSLPTNGDTLVFTNSSNSVRYGLTALSAITLAELIITQSYTGEIGLPNYDTEGYGQYRDKFLQLGATQVQIGSGEGQGSGRIKLNFGSAKTTVNVNNSGTALDRAYNAIILKGTHAENALNILQGSVDLAPDAGDATTFSDVRVTALATAGTDVKLRMGSSVTLTNVSVNGGTVDVNSATTSLVVHGGEVILREGDHDSIEVYGGKLDWRTTGEISGLLASNAIIELGNDLRTKDFAAASTIELFRGAVLRDPAGVLPADVKVRDNTGGVSMIFPASKTYQVF